MQNFIFDAVAVLKKTSQSPRKNKPEREIFEKIGSMTACNNTKKKLAP